MQDIKAGGGFNYILSVLDAKLGLPFVLAQPIKVRICAIEGICNLSCKTCQPFGYERKRELSFELFKKILDKLEYVFEVNLSGHGEPFMVKDIFRIIEYAKSNYCRVYMITNMTLVNEEMATKIVRLQLDGLGISFDAATKPLFEKIRVGADFDSIINNIKTLNLIKKSLGSKKPNLCLHVTALKENIHEMPSLVELAHQLDIPKIFVNPLNIRNKGLAVENQSLENYPELARDLFSQAREKAKLLNIAFLCPGQRKDCVEKTDHCVRPWIMPDILVDGAVCACCAFHTSLGNIITDGLARIWNGRKYRAIRRVVSREGNVCYHCRKALDQLKI